ncbi:hypothetical protein AURANDRAFT_12971, partial [Aureococcus anophagefferens]
LDAELERKLLDAFAPEVHEAGDVVVWQGDWGDAYYAVESGAVEILVDGSRPDRMAPITSGGGFGELALALGTRRAATARCVVRAKVWSLTRSRYRSTLGAAAHASRKGRVEFLRSVELFKILSDTALEKLAGALTEKVYAGGAVLIKEGEVGDAFYVVNVGVVEVTTKAGVGVVDDKGALVAELGEGAYFGETAILKDTPRNADVVALEPCGLLKLTRDDFVKLLGPLEDAL